jgi:hypothetical protein
MNHFQTRQRDWDNRLKSGFNPYHGCSQHKDCHDVDMNMVSSKVDLGKGKLFWNNASLRYTKISL